LAVILTNLGESYDAANGVVLVTVKLDDAVNQEESAL
jgi:hypothetical protein